MGKNLHPPVESIESAHPEAEVPLWTMDEHRLGLHPGSGATDWWLLPRVNIDLFNRAIADFAAHCEIGAQRQVVLVVDQAGWHPSERVVLPEGLHLAFLPRYSPHLQPVERLWPLLNEALANQVFQELRS